MLTRCTLLVIRFIKYFFCVLFLLYKLFFKHSRISLIKIK